MLSSTFAEKFASKMSKLIKEELKEKPAQNNYSESPPSVQQQRQQNNFVQQAHQNDLDSDYDSPKVKSQNNYEEIKQDSKQYQIRHYVDKFNIGQNDEDNEILKQTSKNKHLSKLKAQNQRNLKLSVPKLNKIIEKFEKSSKIDSESSVKKKILPARKSVSKIAKPVKPLQYDIFQEDQSQIHQKQMSIAINKVRLPRQWQIYPSEKEKIISGKQPKENKNQKQQKKIGIKTQAKPSKQIEPEKTFELSNKKQQNKQKHKQKNYVIELSDEENKINQTYQRQKKEKAKPNGKSKIAVNQHPNKPQKEIKPIAENLHVNGNTKLSEQQKKEVYQIIEKYMFQNLSVISHNIANIIKPKQSIIGNTAQKFNNEFRMLPSKRIKQPQIIVQDLPNNFQTFRDQKPQLPNPRVLIKNDEQRNNYQSNNHYQPSKNYQPLSNSYQPSNGYRPNNNYQPDNNYQPNNNYQQNTNFQQSSKLSEAIDYYSNLLNQNRPIHSQKQSQREKIMEMIERKVQKIEKDHKGRLNDDKLKKVLIAEAIGIMRSLKVDKNTEASIIKEWITKRNQRRPQ